MVTIALAVIAYGRAFFVARHNLALEAVALRQQLVVFKRSSPVPNCTASIACFGLRSAAVV